MNSDAELLSRFSAHHSEAAFTELVHRHLPMVHATALRRVGGDNQAAEDITQQVFVSLAHKASALRGHATVAGWLYVATHHATAEFVRREQRRKQREATAHSMQLTDSSSGTSDAAAQLRPLLDDALLTLKPDEREVIVLRFFAGRTFAEIGRAVQLSEDATRKRVDRALEKLQGVLARRGVTSSAFALGAVLVAAGAVAVPAGLAVKVAGTACAEAVAPGIAATLTGLTWPAVATVAVLGGAVLLLPQLRANTALAAEVAQREIKTRTALSDLQTENRRLARDLDQLVAATSAPAQRVSSPPTLPPPSTAARVAPSAREIRVSPEGALTWEGKSVTLDDFLLELGRYQKALPPGETRLVIKAPGARFMQMKWVLEQARLAGVGHLTIESDAVPPAWVSTWF